MYFAKIPNYAQQLYPGYRWKISTEKKELYLTFDDGPTPQISDWVRTELAKYNAKATFFVLGRQVEAHSDIVHRLLDEGHTLGNHSQTHVNGWKVSLFRYLLEFKRAQKAIKHFTGAKTLLFRPPYGKISAKQASFIQRSHQIVMMDVMPGDFDNRIDKEECLDRAIKHSEPGSVICLHDSVKAWPHLEYVLPRFLEHFSNKGYRFKALNPIPEQLQVIH